MGLLVMGCSRDVNWIFGFHRGFMFLVFWGSDFIATPADEPGKTPDAFLGWYWNQSLSSYVQLLYTLIIFDILWSSLTNPIHLRFQTSHWTSHTIIRSRSGLLRLQKSKRGLQKNQPMRLWNHLMFLGALILECWAWDEIVWICLNILLEVFFF